MKGSAQLEFGNVSDEDEKWDFGVKIVDSVTIDNLLVGYYGYSKNNNISQIGFISLDLKCIANKQPAPVEEEEEVTPPTTEAEGGMPLGLLIGIGTGIILILIVVVLFIFYKKKKESETTNGKTKKQP